MAKIIGIHEAPTTSKTTVYDPTCGSGSLLLKVGEEARTKVTLYSISSAAGTLLLLFEDTATHLVVRVDLQQIDSALGSLTSGQHQTTNSLVKRPESWPLIIKTPLDSL